MQVYLQPGKIYYIQYQGGVKILGRVKGVDTVNIYYFDYLYKMPTYEKFIYEDELYSELEGIEEVRAATYEEKTELLSMALTVNSI